MLGIGTQLPVHWVWRMCQEEDPRKRSRNKLNFECLNVLPFWDISELFRVWWRFQHGYFCTTSLLHIHYKFMQSVVHLSPEHSTLPLPPKIFYLFPPLEHSTLPLPPEYTTLALTLEHSTLHLLPEQFNLVKISQIHSLKDFSGNFVTCGHPLLIIAKDNTATVYM